MERMAAGMIILLLGVAVEVDAGLASAVGEAAHLAPEAHALHAARARRGPGAALEHLAAPSLLVVVAGDAGGIRNAYDERYELMPEKIMEQHD